METAQARAVRSTAPQAQFAPSVAQPLQAAPQHPFADRLRDIEHEAPATDMRRSADPFQIEPDYVPAREESQPIEPGLSIPAATIGQDASEQSDVSSEPARSGIGKLRQDMIADAQRAKQRAAAEQAAKAADATAGKPKRAPAASTQGAAASSPKLRLALLAVLALLSASAAYKMLIPVPVPVPVEEPAATAPAKTGAPGAAQQQGSLPAAPPQVKAPGDQQTPAAGSEKPAVNGMINGMMFETDPLEEPIAAPVKASDTDPLAPLPGMRLRQSTETVSPMNLAILQHQQNMANLSGKLGETAANMATPAAFMKEVPITALAATPATAAQLGAVGTEVAATGTRSSALDLPPATVGPLSLRLAAAKGDASAEFEAASRLAEGKGTSQNFKEALRWYQRSAAQGFAQAQYRLGTLYERGLGIKADAATARSWYQRAAEQGNVKAMHNLAVLSAGRQNGSPDYATAAQWFTSAAERDLQDSQYNLGVLFESGMGVEQSPKVAMKWFSLAARAGDAESVRRRDALKAQLSPQDLADVAGQVAAFEAVRVSDPLINDARAAGEDWKKRMDGNEQG